MNNRGGVVFSHSQTGCEFNAPYKHVEKDWFFHNPTRANVGSLGRVPDVPADAITSPEYQVWRIKRGLSADFVEILIHLPFFLELVQCHRVGAVKERLFVENLFEIPIPAPNEHMQRSIVARCRAAQAQIAAADARVQEIEARIPQLVYEALGTPAPASAAAACKVIVLQWADLERWSFNYISRARAGLLGFSTSRYPIVRLADHLVGTMNGYCIKPVIGPTPYRMLKLSALRPDGLDLNKSKYVKVPEPIAKRFCIHKDDLMICRSVGTYEMVAKCAVVDADAPGILFPDIIIRARLRDSLLPAYVREVMQTPLGRSYFQSNARTAVGMWKIGADDIASFPIPLPPLSVQRKLEEHVAAARAEIAREREVAANLAQKTAAAVEALILGTRD